MRKGGNGKMNRRRRQKGRDKGMKRKLVGEKKEVERL